MKKFTINATYLGHLLEMLDVLDYLKTNLYSFSNEYLEKYLNSTDSSSLAEAESKSKLKILLIFSKFYDGKNGRKDLTGFAYLGAETVVMQQELINSFSMTYEEIGNALDTFSFNFDIQEQVNREFIIEAIPMYFNTRELSILKTGLDSIPVDGTSNAYVIELKTLKSKLYV